ncbi:hypothetical protein GV64_15875 [Endozoicomonas elysicola]|uniref:Uncharacterized protein n=1 Tax=Endozoicomonas elysicola TaxID=305900 RepID=A0A081KCY0_9GAMM|nr:hypothetical protein GV64_15875 [Endozoicomonas elysicola]
MTPYPFIAALKALFIGGQQRKKFTRKVNQVLQNTLISNRQFPEMQIINQQDSGVYEACSSK